MDKKECNDVHTPIVTGLGFLDPNRLKMPRLEPPELDIFDSKRYRHGFVPKVLANQYVVI